MEAPGWVGGELSKLTVLAPPIRVSKQGSAFDHGGIQGVACKRVSLMGYLPQIDGRAADCAGKSAWGPAVCCGRDMVLPNGEVRPVCHGLGGDGGVRK